MSRLGKLPINLPASTQAKIEEDFIVIKGPKGELKQRLNDIVMVELKDASVSSAQNAVVTAAGAKQTGLTQGQKIIVKVKNSREKREKSLWGLYRSLINNMVIGVTDGFMKKLEINGVGYRVSVSGKKLILNVGFSKPVEYNLPEGITINIEDNIITVSGIDKQLVGESAAQIRRIRKPEPYKGKGIKYVDEVIRRKAGKAAVKSE